jgi:hypothetical protein
LAASCARKAEWPPANEQDRGDTIYVAATTADGAEVVAVSASGEVRRLGLRCDDQSGVALAPDGRRLYYGRDSALHEYELANGADNVVASFPGGVAREKGTDEKGREKTYAWRCGARFRDVTFGPKGRLAFLADPSECPLPEGELPPEEEGAFKPRTDFRLEAGAYLLEPGAEAPRYLGPTRALYAFLGPGEILLEHKLTVARFDLRTGEVRPVLPAKAHELGWVPPAVVSGEKIIIVGAKAAEKSQQDILNRLYVVEGGKGAEEPALEIERREPVTRAALSPDGRYLAVQATPQVFGEPAILLVDLETRDYKVLVEGGRLFRFAAGSGALFYLAGRGRAGDLFVVGLDGVARQLTSDGAVLPAP